MTAIITFTFLQEYWWTIISLLGGLLLFLMFVQGGQSFIFSLPRTSQQKTMLVNALGKKWELTFTTLVTFGGAFFAAFPLFYSTSFGGASLLWLAILSSFILEAVAYEFRSKPSNIFGQKAYDFFLFFNGCLGPFLIGVAIGTFFTGSDFSLDSMNRVTWGNNWHGLEALAKPLCLLSGLTVLFLSRVLGLLYLINVIDDKDLVARSGKELLFNSVAFIIVFVPFVIILLSLKGYCVTPGTGTVKTAAHFYLNNLFGNFLTALFFFAGVLLILNGIISAVFRMNKRAFRYSAPGAIAVGMALFFLAGFGGSAFYPSSAALQSSLTIANASSGRFTLKVMMFVSFFIPVVVLYIWYAWRAISSRSFANDGSSEKPDMY